MLRSLIWAGGLASLLLVAAPITAAEQLASVTLAWDPSSSSGIAGYRLYYGTASHTYTNMIDVGNATTGTVSNLVPGVTYFFAVTDYDTNGQESDFSAEVIYTVPVTTAPTLPTLGIGLAASSATGPGAPAQPPPPVVILTITGQPGQAYNVLFSQDLQTWIVIGTVTLDATGSGQFTDPGGTGAAIGFYRLQAP